MKKYLFKLTDLQLFAEEKKEEETDTLKIVKEEYEKKLEQQKSEYETRIKTMQETHANEIRVILSGRGKVEERTKENEEISFEERLLKDTRKKLGIKEVKKDE